ncbi:hypothetical protein ACSQ67_009217 [Phaseolus vulgaris]
MKNPNRRTQPLSHRKTLVEQPSVNIPVGAVGDGDKKRSLSTSRLVGSTNMAKEKAIVAYRAGSDCVNEESFFRRNLLSQRRPLLSTVFPAPDLSSLTPPFVSLVPTVQHPPYSTPNPLPSAFSAPSMLRPTHQSSSSSHKHSSPSHKPSVSSPRVNETHPPFDGHRTRSIQPGLGGTFCCWFDRR